MNTGNEMWGDGPGIYVIVICLCRTRYSKLVVNHNISPPQGTLTHPRLVTYTGATMSSYLLDRTKTLRVGGGDKGGGGHTRYITTTVRKDQKSQQEVTQPAPKTATTRDHLNLLSGH